MWKVRQNCLLSTIVGSLAEIEEITSPSVTSEERRLNNLENI